MFDDTVLDDEDQLAARDQAGVLMALAGAGAQVRQAIALCEETKLSSWADFERPRAIVVAARGGAAIVADALSALVGRGGSAPVISVSGETLPQWVGPGDFVICASLSGASEGALACAHEAGRRGSLLLSIGAGGSPLEQACAIARGIHIPIPSSGRGVIAVPTSRTALWALLTPAFIACRELGVIADGDVDLDRVAELLDEHAENYRPGSETFVNPAKTLASELAEAIPVMLGHDDVAGVAAHRAASTLSRTARIPAVRGELPDDAGNIVATFGGPFATASESSIFADPFDGAGQANTKIRLVILGGDEGRTSRAILQIAERAHVPASIVDCDARTDLGRMAGLMACTDFASTYLALACNIDPSINPHVADLRDALR